MPRHLGKERTQIPKARSNTWVSQTLNLDMMLMVGLSVRIAYPFLSRVVDVLNRCDLLYIVLKDGQIDTISCIYGLSNFYLVYNNMQNHVLLEKRNPLQN